MASSGRWAVGSGQAQKTQAGDGWTFGGSLPPARARVVTAAADAAAAANANAAGFGRALALA